MRTCSFLCRLSLLCLFYCAAAFSQTPPPNAIPLITQVSPPSITPAASPSQTPPFSLTILGANFPANPAVTMTVPGGPSITASSVSVNSTGTQIVALFNSQLPRPAVYKVLVSNAVNNPAAISNAYYLPVTPSASTVGIAQNSSEFLTGTPVAIAIADFNNDGNPDVATLSQNPNTLSILLGNFNGSLNSGSSYPIGNFPTGIVAADFNGDGILDLAVTNAQDNTIDIFLGNGDGTFRQGSTISDPGTYPTKIVAADFNGDGHLDLALLNVCGPVSVTCYPQAAPQGPGSVLVLLGNGDGTFSVSSSAPSTGNVPSAIAAADINSDGLIDLVVVNQSDNTVSLLMGNGDGTFTPAQSTVPTGNSPSGIAIADFNRDGELDLAVTNSTDATVSILLNQNCGLPASACTFAAAPIAPAVGTSPIAITAADMNADGFLDLVVANQGSSSITVLLGNGTGAFTAVTPQQLANFSTGSTPQALALADFSADGRFDIATVNASGSYSILTQTPVPQVVLSTNLSSITYGMVPTFTATINPPFDPNAQPTGTVTLFDGSNSLGTTSLSGYQANFFISTLSAGTHQLTATYNGDSNFLASTSAPITETVTQASTTLTLSSSLNGVPFGQSLTLSASFTSHNANAPTGTVIFFDTSTSTSLGTATLANGTASLTLSSLSPGSHAIIGTYSGDANFLGSSSAPFTEAIVQASTTASVATSQSPINLGQTPTFTATVQPSASTAATGQVTFYDNGSTVLGIASLTNNSASLQAPVLAVGSHAITTKYAGDTNYTGSTSSPILEQVNTAADVVNLSTTPTVYGQAATFTVTVQSVNFPGTPTGTVTFSDGSTILGSGLLSNGSTQFTISTLAVGTHQISASYSGNSNFQAGTSAQVPTNVFKANTTAVVASAQNPSSYNQPISLTATVQPAFGGAATGTVTFFDGSVTLGTGTLTNNIAVLSISSLAVGTHSISVSYPGDNNVNGSVSSTLTQTVNPSPTTITLTSNTNPSTYGQSIALAATVKAAYGTASPSTVSFYDGTTLLGTVNTATAPPQISMFTLTAGAHSITAQYAGNSNYASSTSAVLTQTVNQASTTTTVTSNLSPSAFGQSVTLGATVNSTYNFASNGGTVTFYDNGVSIGSVVIEGNGVSLPISTLATGSHSITASYGGDSNLGASTSTVFAQTVNQAPVSPTITLSSYNTTYGQSITMTSNVRPTYGGTPTGTVTFWLNSTTSLGTGTVVSGTAQAITTAVPAGSRSIYATYNGDTNFATASSLPTQLTVAQATSTTTAYADVNPASYGQTVNLSASVQSTGGTPTGSATFLDGSATLGTATLANGTAKLAVATFAPGSHSITIQYSGDSNFSASTSSAFTETVNPATTTTTLSPSLNPATAGQSVTLTATVQSSSGAAVSGTVTFLDGSTTLGTATLSSGSAQFTTSSLAPGTHSLTAAYTANADFAASTSSLLSETVNQIATTTTLSSSLNPASAGQSVTFTATIQGGPGNSATGTVTFMDGSTTLGTATVSSNSAQFTTTTLAAGSHSITAVYGGSTNFAGSTSTVLTQTINLISTTTTVASSVNPALAGQSVTFTATIQPGSGNSATGIVTFMDGSTSLGSATVSSNSAQLAVSTLAVGTHSITAVYSGSSTFATSTSSALTESVNQSSTTTSLVSNLNPATFGQAVQFVATVQPASGGLATGTVSFYDGSTLLSTAVVTNNGVQHNVATLTYGGFLGGTQSITAAYSGDANNAASTSSVLTETVITASSSVSVGASANPSSFGQTVTLTATVVPSVNGDLATGTVTFFDGSTSLGVVSVSSSDVVQLSTASLAIGTHSITASYSGDRNFAASTSGTWSEVINSAITSTVITSSANPSPVGKSVSFTATVSSSVSGTQAGSVSFYLDGSNTAAATVTLKSGTAKFSTSSLTAGTHSVVAVFTSTNSTFAGSTSSPFTENISDFGVAVTPSSQTIARGNSGTYTLTLSSLGEFSGSVSLSCSGEGSNATCSVSPASVTLSGSGSEEATATVTVSSHDSTGTHTLTFTATSGSTTHKTTATLTID
jgi:hypothetical protein